MSTSVGSIHYDLSLDTSKFDKAAVSLNSKIGNTADTIGKFASGMSNGFDTVADSMSKFAMKSALLIGAGTFGISKFINLAGELQTTNRQMVALTGSTEGANKVFGELYNYTLGKPIAFPDASKAAQVLMGYGVSADKVMESMKTLSRFSIVNGADMSQLALAYGQVNAKGKLMGQEIIQLTNNFVPVASVIAKYLKIPITEAQAAMEGGKISAQQFNEAMANFIPESDIAKQSDTFKNRMISLQGSIRSVGLAILGVRIDSQKGLVVDQSGLFARLTDALKKLADWLKENKKAITNFANTLINNAIPAISAFAAAFLIMKIGSFVSHIGAAVAGLMQFKNALNAGKTAMVAFNTISSMNPFIAIATVIAVVTAAIVYLGIKFGWFTKIIETAKPIIESLNNAMKLLLTGDFKGGIFGLQEDSGIIVFLINLHRVLKAVADFIMGQLKSALDSLKRIWDQLVLAMKPLIDIFKEFWQKHGKQVMQVLKVIGMVIGALMISGLVISFGLLLGALKLITVVLKFVADHFEAIKKVVLVLLAIVFAPLILTVLSLIGVFKLLQAAVQFLPNFFVSAWQTIYNTVSGAMNTIKNTIVSVWQAIWGFIQPILNFILNLHIIVWGSILLLIINVVKFIYNTIVSIWQLIWGFLQPILTMILNFYITTFTTIYNVIVGVIQGIWNIIVSVWSAIWGFLAPIISTIWSYIVNTFNSIYATLANIFYGILNIARSVWNTIYAVISGAINNVRNFFAGAGSWLYNAGRNIIEGLWRGISDMAGRVFQKAQEIADGVKNRIKNALGIRSPSKVMIGLGLNVGEGLAIGLQKTMPDIKDIATNMAGNIQSPVANFTPAMSTGNTTSVNNNIYGNITLGDTAAVNTFFNRLDRNGELARKGMATI